MNVLLFVYNDGNIIVQSQHIKCTAGGCVFGSVRPNVYFCVDVEFPHWFCLAVIKEDLTSHA